jgi:hypothetical protein
MDPCPGWTKSLLAFKIRFGAAYPTKRLLGTSVALATWFGC